MNIKAPEHYTAAQRIAFYDVPENVSQYLYGTRGGWVKEPSNPVLGGSLGTCFDVSVLEDGGRFKMWFSWRPHNSIGYCESPEGIHWDAPRVVLSPLPGSPWESDEVTRPCVIKRGGVYHMWYSAHVRPYREDGRSVIAYARSDDGISWHRRDDPVLEPDGGWEMQALMCPCVLYDEQAQRYRMWYSGGCNHEPDAIGYAESPDGLRWTRQVGHPVLTKKPDSSWDRHKVVACHVLKLDGWYYMFYVGHFHEERAYVGLARSRDGMSGWQYHPDNPLIAPDEGAWDSVSIYKPYVLRTGDRWMMWYNGAMYDEPIWVFEQIGVACLDAPDFGFPD